MINKIIDEILAQQQEDQVALTPRQANAKAVEDLQKLSDVGRSAMELENSKAFKDLIEPYTKSVLQIGFKQLLVLPVNSTNDDKTAIIERIKAALNIYALIRKAKSEAKKANTILTGEKRKAENNQRRNAAAEARTKKALRVINRKENALKKKEGKEEVKVPK